jgi:hypothetical protein
LSIKEIALRVRASQSSVSTWVRDIVLSDAQACHLFADHAARRAEIEQYWLDALGLSRASLTKSQVNAYSRSSGRKRRNVLPYGTCRVTVCSVDVVQHIYGAIQEYGGFERPEWLG